MKQNGWNLRYPIDKETETNAFSSAIEDCAAGKVDKNVLMDWFDSHKIKIKGK